MSRIDFGWCIFENVEERFLSMFLHAWTRSCIRILYSCLILEALHTWEWSCVCGVLSMYVGFDPRTWDAWQKFYSAHSHLLFIYFTSTCNLNTLFFFFFHFCIQLSLYPSFYLHSYIKTSYFLNSAWIRNLISPSFFIQSSSPYVGRGSTNKVVEWYNLLVHETRGYIQEAGFEPIIALLSKMAKRLYRGHHPWS